MRQPAWDKPRRPYLILFEQLEKPRYANLARVDALRADCHSYDMQHVVFVPSRYQVGNLLRHMNRAYRGI